MISWDRDFSTINITDKDMLPNSYQIKLHIDITSDSLLKQNICFERIKFFIDYVVDKSVLVHKAHKKLKSIILSEEYKSWKFLSGKKFLNEAMIEYDKRLLKNFYLNKGYFNVIINSSISSSVSFLNNSIFRVV